jgi:hypothetical protein
MDELVRSLPEGSAARAELTRQLRAVRDGQQAEVKTHADAAFKALDDFDKQQGEKVGKSGLVTQKTINDGFLQDNRKLAALGFSPEQITEIGAKFKTPKGEDREATNASRESAFKRLWEYRANKGKESSDILTLKVAEAIVNGKESVDYEFPEAAAAKALHYQQAGERRAKLADFLKLNPKATPAEIDEKILGIAGEQTTKNLRSGLYDPKPVRPLSTTSLNIKLSNYGYADDTTPDSNSARGIGHSDNKLEDGKSAAISKSLATRLGLKTGDEVEIETTKGKFRVRYDDTVPSTDSRTGDLPETIDLYRKKDGANNWGGKVTKITKIS